MRLALCVEVGGGLTGLIGLPGFLLLFMLMLLFFGVIPTLIFGSTLRIAVGSRKRNLIY